MRPDLSLALIPLMLALLPPASATEAHGSAALTATVLDYQGSALRRDYRQQTLELGLEASPALGLQASLGRGVVGYVSAPDLEERNLALLLRGKNRSGAWTWRAGAMRLEDRQGDLPDQRHDTVLAGLGWWPDPERLLDIGYSHTRLDSGLAIDQLSPMIGGSFDDRYTWIQLRGHLQRFSQTTEGLNHAAAAELKLTRWLQPGAPLKPGTLQAMVAGGRQLYGADHDSLALFAQPYVQTGAAWAGAGWRLGGTADLLLLAGGSRSRSDSLADTLNTRFAYLNLSTHW